MNEGDYVQLQITMGTIFKQINVLPLDELIEQTQRALDFVPFFDPTLWMKKNEDAERMLRIAKAYKLCRDTIAKEFKKND